MNNHRYQSALRTYNAGNTTKAYQEIQSFLKSNHRSAEAWHFKGIIELEQGELETAFQSINHAVELAPDNAEFWNNLAVAAERCNQLDFAIKAYQRAHILLPSNLKYRKNLADLYFIAGLFHLAEPHYEVLYEHSKDNESINLRYVTALIEAQHYSKALLCIEEIESKSPSNNLILLKAIALRHTNQLKQAIDLLQLLIKTNPSHSIQLELMVCYLNQANYNDAKKLASELMQVTFNNPMSYHAVAKVLLECGDYTNAKILFDKALSFQSQDVTLYTNAIHNAFYLKDYGRLFAIITNALKLFPNDLAILSLAFQFEAEHLNWKNAETFKKHILEIISQSNKPAPISHYMALHIADNYSDLKKLTKINNTYEGVDNTKKQLTLKKYQHEKIRIAYISPDFRSHCVGLLLGDIFKYHDRNQFEIYAYDTKGVADSFQQTIKNSVDNWQTVAALSDSELAIKIADNEIDILIDLAGLTKASRQKALSLKPAPIIGHFLGDFGTLATSYHDFYLTHQDNIPETEEHYFTENLCFLPMPHVVVDYPHQDYSPTRADFNLPEDKFILCCFNNALRINQQTAHLWLEILKATTDSNTILWLYDQSEVAKKNLMKLCDEISIDFSRIYFLEKVYLTEKWPMKVADLYLDTCYLTGFTSVLLSYSANLPVLTSYLPGTMSRESSIINKLLGFENTLLATSEKDYVKKAIHLIKHPDLLKEIKTSIAEQKAKKQSIFDAESFIKRLEEAYKAMYQQYQNGDAFRKIVIR